MRIGLMLRNIEEQGGAGEYARRISRALPEVDRRNDYLLLFPSPDTARRFTPAGARAGVVEAPGKLLWDQVAVPRVLAREQVDVVLGTKHSIPLLTRPARCSSCTARTGSRSATTTPPPTISTTT
jgi:hypothetical protein